MHSPVGIGKHGLGRVDPYQSRDCDPQECPFRNRCMLLQGDRVWNCVCVEL